MVRRIQNHVRWQDKMWHETDTEWTFAVASCICMRLPVRMCKHVVAYNIMNHQQNCTSGKWQTCRDKDCSYVRVIQTIICCGLADPAKSGIFSVITLLTFWPEDNSSSSCVPPGLSYPLLIIHERLYNRDSLNMWQIWIKSINVSNSCQMGPNWGQAVFSILTVLGLTASSLQVQSVSSSHWCECQLCGQQCICLCQQPFSASKDQKPWNNNPGNQTCSHWPKSAVSAGRRSEWKKRGFFGGDIFVLRWKEAAFKQERPNHGRTVERWSKKGQYLLKILVIFWTRCLCEVLVNHQAADYWKCVWVLLLHTRKIHSTYSIIQCVGSSTNKQSQYKQTELNVKVQLYIKNLLTFTVSLQYLKPEWE